jgi:hypothetical protein
VQLQRLERPAPLQQLQLPPQHSASTSTLQPTCQRLQPHVPEAAIPRARGCNPTCQRLQPHAPDLQPLRNPAIAVAAQERVSAAALLLVGLRPSAAGSVLPAYAAAARLRFGVR